LILGILLAKAGIHILLLEESATLNTNPRAAHYAPSSVRELRRCGLLKEVQDAGYMPQGVCWRTSEGDILAGISPDPSYEDAMVCLPLDKLIVILSRNLQSQQSSEVRFNHKVISIEQDDKQANVKVETDEGMVTLEADFVIGCDGANSQVRKSLYGDEFHGETLESQIIATNVMRVPSHALKVADLIIRYTTTSINLTIGTRNSYCTLKTGTSLPRLVSMDYGESHTATFQV
jgi:2-polyprenyl-6-methoxyphenol hydroxylase-like FAD-dependent oxidoreductase